MNVVQGGGYSFPDSDIHVKYLLKRMELYQGRTPEIYIINNHKDKTIDSMKNEFKRYYRFFKDKEKIHYTKLSFEDFCNKDVEAKDIINQNLVG